MRISDWSSDVCSSDLGLVDTDGTPAPVLASFTGSRSKAWSQELRASGDLTQSLSYIAGGYWSRETGYEYSRSQVFGGLFRDTFADVGNITKGRYAQLYYQLKDRLGAADGFRHKWDTRR